MEVTDEIESLIAHWRECLPAVETDSIRISIPLRRAMQAAEGQRHVLLGEHGLTPGTFDLLVAIHRLEESGSCTPSELSRVLVLTSGRISQRLESLEEQELVRRRVQPSDRRLVSVHLTKAGERLLTSLMERYMSQEEEMLSKLSAKDRGELSRLLIKLHDSIVKP